MLIGNDLQAPAEVGRMEAPPAHTHLSAGAMTQHLKF